MSAITLEEPISQVALTNATGDEPNVNEEQVELNYILDELKTLKWPKPMPKDPWSLKGWIQMK